MFAYNNCRFALLLLLSVSANAETIRGAHRQLDAATPSTNNPDTIWTFTHDYAILAEAGISTVPSSTINGNIGVSPIAATAITGFALTADSTTQFSTSTQVVGQVHAASYGSTTEENLTTAVSDMHTAYDSAAASGLTSDGKLNLGDGVLGGAGTTQLSRGVYTFQTSVNIAGNFEFIGTDTDIFIIQITGDLLQVAGTIVTLVSDGSDSTVPQKENIFWQVAGTAVVKANAHMEGILLVKTAVTFEDHSSLNGRVLTQTRCDIDQTTITK
jgi:hypothetical protein